MQDVFPPYRAVLGPGLAIEPRVPQKCMRTYPPGSLLPSLGTGVFVDRPIRRSPYSPSDKVPSS
jgi:hypothetical protein